MSRSEPAIEVVQERVPAAAGERLRVAVQRLARRRGVHHLVFSIAGVERPLRWEATWGRAHPEADLVRIDTPFLIASIDKLFTAAVLLSLWEGGLVDLEECIADLLPADQVHGLHRMDGTDYGASITVRHLLRHTSGLPDYQEDRPKGGISLVEGLLRDGDRAWRLEDALTQVRKLSPYFPPQPPPVEHQRIRYSETNYLLLQAIIERICKQSIDRVFHEKLIRPLGLSSTWIAGSRDAIQPAREPASLWFQNRPLDLPLAFASMRAVFSTAADLETFLRALVTGRLFSRADTFRIMQAPWRRFGLPKNAAALRAPSWPIEYGMGLMRFSLPRWFAPWRATPALIGHTGSTGSWLFWCEDLDLMLVGTVDQVTAAALPFRALPGIVRELARHGHRLRAAPD